VVLVAGAGLVPSDASAILSGLRARGGVGDFAGTGAAGVVTGFGWGFEGAGVGLMAGAVFATGAEAVFEETVEVFFAFVGGEEILEGAAGSGFGTSGGRAALVTTGLGTGFCVAGAGAGILPEGLGRGFAGETGGVVGPRAFLREGL
jgi:hypothetical protein